MPPKIRITKEEIVSAAVKLVQKSGAENLNARTLALALNCSTQPIFSNFASMEELRLAVVEAADSLCGNYIEKEIKRGVYPPYKASGMAYIGFAKEEKELFKLLYMRNRSEETVEPSSTLNDKMAALVQGNTGLTKETATLFHLEMWAFVHGIASMMATDFINLDWELISDMLTHAYKGLLKVYGLE